MLLLHVSKKQTEPQTLQLNSGLYIYIYISSIIYSEACDYQWRKNLRRCSERGNQMLKVSVQEMQNHQELLNLKKRTYLSNDCQKMGELNVQ